MPAEDLLITKLMPPRLHASLIRRPELFARLDEGLERRLTLITAPTGFGKTTLVSLWIKSHAYPAAWVTFDGGDNDPARFWRYVISAIRQINGEIGKSALATLRVSQQPSFTALLTGLINELTQLPAPTILALDDIHTIHSAEVLESLAFLIEHLPPNIHMLALARSLSAASQSGSAASEPDWPVELLRARGELNELHANELRFSTAEIEAFLQETLPGQLPRNVVKRLEEKTEGWPAGVRLVTLAIQAKNQPVEQVIETFNGEHRFVLAYLRKEVLDQQPEPIRSFLLQTCFLDRLTGSLCDWLTGREDSAALLEQMEQDNLFLMPLGASHGLTWYRYQSLFAEAMRHQSVQELGEPVVRELSAKASQWYEQHSLLEEAIASAIAAKQAERAAGLIERFLEQRSFYEILIPLRWSEQLPEETLHQHPLVAFNYALALLFSSDRYAPATAAAVLPLLESAEHAWRKQGNDAGAGEVLAVKGIMEWWQGDLKSSFQSVHQALKCLPESDLLWRSTALIGLGTEDVLDGSLHDARINLMEARALSGAVQNIHSVLAAIQILADVDYLQGELEPSAASLRQVLVDAIGGDEMLDDQSIAWFGLARIAYERNDLRTAEEQARRALDLGIQRANEAAWAPAAVLLAWTAHARGESGEARNQLQSLVGRVHLEQTQRDIWTALARLSLLAGDLPAARHWQDLISTLPPALFAAQRERTDLLAARLELAAGAPDRTLELIRPWQTTAQEQGRLRREIKLLSLEAQALDRLGHPAQSAQKLAAALSLAQPKGLRRIFLDEGEPLARLIQTTIPALPRRGLGVYAMALLHSFSLQGPAGSPNETPTGALLVEPLSAQEIRVLRLLAAGLSNPEIAEELVVSVNTIKTQVQSIYRKLNVNAREEARLAARELHLV